MSAMARVYAGASDRWHEDYDLGRPGWPAEVVQAAEVPPTATVLELGAGTGKLTRLLVTAFAEVVAVEPDEGMRRLLGPLCPDARVLAGSAEEIPLPSRSVDAVFAAESFHWFDGGRAVDEITRALRPGGALVLMWNVPAGPTEPSLEAVEQLVRDIGPSEAEIGYDPMDLNHRRYRSAVWRHALAESRFEELRELRLANPQTLDRDALVAFLASMGWVADLPEARRQSLLDAVRPLLTAAEYRRPWETRLFWTRLEAKDA
jgi:SAM-dependent methyltransferase